MQQNSNQNVPDYDDLHSPESLFILLDLQIFSNIAIVEQANGAAPGTRELGDLFVNFCKYP